MGWISILFTIIIVIVVLIVFAGLVFYFLNPSRARYILYEQQALIKPFDNYAFPVFYIYKSKNKDYISYWKDLQTIANKEKDIPDWYMHDIAYPLSLAAVLYRLNYEKNDEIYGLLKKFADKIGSPWKRFGSPSTFLESLANLWDKMLWFTVFWAYCKKHDIPYHTEVEDQVRAYWNTPISQTSYTVSNLREGFYDDNSFIFRVNVPLQERYMTNSLRVLVGLKQFYTFEKTILEKFEAVLYLNADKFKDIHEMGYAVSKKDINTGYNVLQILNPNKTYNISQMNLNFLKSKYSSLYNVAKLLYPYVIEWKTPNDFKWNISKELDVINSRVSNFKFYRNNFLLQVASNAPGTKFESSGANDDLHGPSTGTQQHYIYYGGYLAEPFTSFNKTGKKPRFSNQFVDTNLQAEQTYYKFSDGNIAILQKEQKTNSCLIFYDVIKTHIYINFFETTEKEEFIVFAYYDRTPITIRKVNNKVFLVNNKYRISSSENLQLNADSRLNDAIIDGNENQILYYVVITCNQRPLNYDVACTSDLTKSFSSLTVYKQIIMGAEDKSGPYGIEYVDNNDEKTRVVMYGSIINPSSGYQNLEYTIRPGQNFIIYEKEFDNKMVKQFSR